jgi:hypothetical protein
VNKNNRQIKDKREKENLFPLMSTHAKRKIVLLGMPSRLRVRRMGRIVETAVVTALRRGG